MRAVWRWRSPVRGISGISQIILVLDFFDCEDEDEKFSG